MGLFLFSFVTESYSQRQSSRSKRSSRDRDTEETTTLGLKDKLAYDIHIGNLGFNSGFFISGKFAAGYKITDPLTAGLGLKAEYGFVNTPGDNDFDVFNYGLYGYARYRIAEQFYAKAEYNYFSSQWDRDNQADREKVSFPMVGGGYISGFSKWKYGFEVLFAVGGSRSQEPYNRQARDVYTFIEYTILFAYNF